MKLKEIVAPTIKDLIKRELIDQILSGKCEVGEKLPTEREMAESMKVSRTVINSALSELNNMGFVKIVARQGVFVDDYSRNGTIDTLIEVMNYHGSSFDKKAFESLLQYRTTAESDCAYLAALYRSDDDLKSLIDIKTQMETETDVSRLASLKVDFHQTLYIATGNTIYPLVYNSFKQLSYSFHKLIYEAYGVDEAVIYLDELIDHIKYKRYDSSKRTMNKLLSYRLDQIREYYYGQYSRL